MRAINGSKQASRSPCWRFLNTFSGCSQTPTCALRGGNAPRSTPPFPRSPAMDCRAAPIRAGHVHREGEAPPQGQWSWTPPHLSKAAEAWSRGPAFPALGEGPAPAPRPTWPCQQGISWHLASTSVVGEGRPLQAAAGLAGGGAALGACPLLKAPPSGCTHPPGWELAEPVFQHPGQGRAAARTLLSPGDSGLQDTGQRRPAAPAPATASARLPGESCSFPDLCLLAPPVSQVPGALLDCLRGHPALPGS